MKIFYTHRAAEELKSLSKPVQKRIVSKMRFYASQENPLTFAKRLVDVREGQFRFRIGDYRVTDKVRNVNSPPPPSKTSLVVATLWIL